MDEAERSSHPPERGIAGKIYQGRDGTSKVVCCAYAHGTTIVPNTLCEWRKSEGRDDAY